MSLSPKSLVKSRLRTLALGVMSIGVAGALAGQTLLSQPGQAFAEPVRVEGQQVVGFADVVEQVTPTVVSVRVKSEVQTTSFNFNGQNPFEDWPGFRDLPQDHPFNRFFRQFGDEQNENRNRPRKRFATGQGSGFFISEDGFIVTNNHVIDKGTEFTVVTSDGTEYDAELIGSDARTDLALLKVDAKTKFKYVKFADADSRIGEWVVAVGNPFGLGGTVTAGILSARGRDIGAGPYDDFLQIDAAVNKGNSGGPAFNLNGEVIGVNTAIFSPSGGNVGIAFAIPAATAKTVIEDLKDDGKVVRGFLGVQIQTISRDIADSLGLANTDGALVTQPQADGPADKAGIRPGDAIVAVNGDPVTSPKDLSRKIASLSPDTDTELTIFRDGKSKTITVRLDKLPDRRQASFQPETPAKPAEPTLMEEFGLELKPSDDGQGVVVTDVRPDSPLAEKGIRRGDVISEIGGQSVKAPKDARTVLEDARKDGKKAVLMRVESNNGTRFLAMPIKKEG